MKTIQALYYLIGIIAFCAAVINILILAWTFDLNYLKYFTTSFIIFVLMAIFDPFK